MKAAYTPEEWLAHCLEAMEEGASLEEALAQVPARYRAEVASLLEVAHTLQTAPPVRPRPTFRRRARQRLLTRLPKAPVPAGQSRRPWTRIGFRLRPLAWAMVVTVFILLFAGTGMVYAATGSLPGDALYPVKRWVEDVRVSLASPEAAAQLQLEILRHRDEEMQTLLARGRFEDLPRADRAFQQEVQQALGLAKRLPRARRDEVFRALLERVVVHEQALRRLLSMVPPQARPGLERALQASQYWRTALEHALTAPDVFGPDHTPGPPPDKGPPEKTPGPPPDKGPPEKTPGPPPDKGPPEETPGPPPDKGPPEKAPGGPPANPPGRGNASGGAGKGKP